MSDQVVQYWPNIGRVEWVGGRIRGVVEDVKQGGTYVNASGSRRYVIAVRDGTVTYRHPGRPVLLSCEYETFRREFTRRVEG